MIEGLAQFKEILGMAKDSVISTDQSKFLYEMKNMRIVDRNNETLLGWENEKGTEYKLSFKDENDSSIQVKILGKAEFSDCVILFAQKVNSPNTDYIYQISIDNHGELQQTIKFHGGLSFSLEHPIETVTAYENENIQKVYWVDGINQLRFLDINNDYNGKPEDIFDVKPYGLQNNMTQTTELGITEDGHSNLIISATAIEKRNYGGYFPSGVIQYFITLSNKNGQESAICYQSPLHYITTNDAGVAADKTSDCSFVITCMIQPLTVFDKINLYSVQYTSIDSVVAKKVGTYKISDIIDEITHKVTITDNGSTGELIMDYKEILTKSGYSYSFKNITSMDNVLFLSNATLKTTVLSSKDKENIKMLFDELVDDDVLQEVQVECSDLATPSNHYDYNFQLNQNARYVTTFKKGEYYRLGVQLKHRDGSWTEPVYLTDYRCTKLVKQENNKLYMVKFMLPYTFIRDVADVFPDFIAIRPVIVYPEIQDRECLCQGVLNPTVYNIRQRIDKTCYAQASWNFRPNAPAQIIPSYDYNSYDSNVATAMTDITGSFTSYVILDKIKEEMKNWKINNPMPASYNTDIEDATFVSLLQNINWNLAFGLGSGYENEYLHIFPEQYDDWNQTIQLLNSWLLAVTGTINPQTGTGWNDGIEWLIALAVHQRDAIEALIVEYGSGVITDTYQAQGGSPVEFRHNQLLHTIATKNGDWVTHWKHSKYSVELQSAIFDRHHLIYQETSNKDAVNVENRSELQDVSHYYAMFGVDQSLFTLNSPELEMDTLYDNYDFSSCKLRIVGVIPLTANYYKAQGVLQNEDGSNIAYNIISPFSDPVKNIANEGWKELVSFPMFSIGINNSNNPTVIQSFHNKAGIQNSKTIKVLNKRFTNLRFSYETVLFENSVWDSNYTGYVNGFDDIQLYNSDEPTLINLKDSKYGTVAYQGTIDQAIMPRDEYWMDVFGNESGYADTGTAKITDGISVKYKSTKHLVFNLHKWQDVMNVWQQPILPTAYNRNSAATVNPIYNIADTDVNPQQISQIGGLTFGQNSPYENFGYLWLGEIYKEIDTDNLFGGKSETAIRNNVWRIAGDEIVMSTAQAPFNLSWLVGDHYYQRYDCLKTYPFTYEDQNQIVEILSFMCYTRVNIDGKYDTRKNLDLLQYANPTNFNQINPVYSQQDNVFTYTQINDDNLSTESPNAIQWSGKKINGAEIDIWTHLNEYNKYYLDCTKGDCTAIKAWKDNLIAFQENAICKIKYNSEQLKTVEGSIVELSTSNIVNGHVILDDKIGCKNKWSICTSSKNMYFIDDNSKTVNVLNGEGIANLGELKHMHSWFYNQINGDEWNPKDMKGFVTYYNKITQEIYFINKDYCLAFNENIGYFTSFYSYDKSSYMFNIGHNSYLTHCPLGIENEGEAIYQLWEGDYNMFFGSMTDNTYNPLYYPFELSMRVSTDYSYDKIFNNTEFRADTWESQTEFTPQTLSINTDIKKLYIETEYQKGEMDLSTIPHYTSPLDRKYRIWRTIIPRAKIWNEHLQEYVQTRDRIRNTWAIIKLTSTQENVGTPLNPLQGRTLVHDLLVRYIK